MHDLVREFVRADTLSDGRNGFDWPALAEGLRRALPVVDQRIVLAERHMPDADQRYTDVEWRDATLDRLNILLWLDEDEAAKRLLLNRWIEARHANGEFAVQLTVLAGELEPKRKDWQRLLTALKAEEYEWLELYSTVLEPHARVVLYYLRAQQMHLYARLGKYYHAINDIQKAIQINRQEAIFYCSLAETYIFMKNYDTALDLWMPGKFLTLQCSLTWMTVEITAKSDGSVLGYYNHALL